MHLQSAIEYIVTYSWAILIMALILAIMFIYVNGIVLIAPSSCSISYGVYCYDLIAGSNNNTTKVIFLLSNAEQYFLYKPSITITLRNNNYTGHCDPNFARSGSSLLCYVSIPEHFANNTLLSGKFYINAYPCPIGNASSCKNNEEESFVGSYNTRVAIVNNLSVSITLFANPEIANVNQTQQIYARLLIFGRPIVGAAIHFYGQELNLTPNLNFTNSNGYTNTEASINESGIYNVSANFSNITKTIPIVFVPNANNITAVVPIKIVSNNTPLYNFQELMNISKSNFSRFLKVNNTYSNLLFIYPNGSIIPYWIENENDTTIRLWLRLSYVKGHGITPIFLEFSKFNELNGIYGGEAYQISNNKSLDNGNNIFNFYENFGNSSINFYTFNAIINSYRNYTIVSANSISFGISNTTNYNKDYIFDIYGSLFTPLFNEFELNNTKGSFGIASLLGLLLAISNKNISIIGITPIRNAVYSIVYNPSSEIYLNYYNIYNNSLYNGRLNTITLYGDDILYPYYDSNFSIEWIRVREYPKNGMPNYYFEGIYNKD